MSEAAFPFDLNSKALQDTVATSVAPDPPMFDTHSFPKWFMVSGILLAWLLLADFWWAARLSDHEHLANPEFIQCPRTSTDRPTQAATESTAFRRCTRLGGVTRSRRARWSS